tara:strand:- start:3106 stop:4302 length:1197 start_codon:yes stop_codon:yes gene_type:complete
MQGLVDTKKEYIKKIQDTISIPIAEKINSLYQLSVENKTGLKGFQNELNLIKDWNNFIIDNEYNDILKKSKVKKLDIIYKHTIINSIKIKIYEYRNYIDSVDIKIKPIKDFIHLCFINVAVWVWKNPYLYVVKNLKKTEIQNNYNIIEKNIQKIVKDTIRQCTPIDDIIEQIEEKYNLNNSENLITQFKDDEKGLTGKIGDVLAKNAQRFNNFINKKDNNVKIEDKEGFQQQVEKEVKDENISQKEDEIESERESEDGSEEESEEGSEKGSEEGSEEGSEAESEEGSEAESEEGREEGGGGDTTIGNNNIDDEESEKDSTEESEQESSEESENENKENDKFNNEVIVVNNNNNNDNSFKSDNSYDSSSQSSEYSDSSNNSDDNIDVKKLEIKTRKKIY